MALRAVADRGTRRTGLRRLGILGLAVPTLVLAASCSALNGSDNSSGGSGSGSVEHPDLKVSSAGIIDTAPFQLAVSKGYFKAEGLNVIATPVASGSENIPKVATGALDIGFSNWASLFSAQAHKVSDFRVVADGAQTGAGVMAVTTYPGSGVNGLKDLVGKTVSTNSPEDVPLLALKALLKANNIDVNRIHIVTVHHPDTPQALAKHQVDAAIQLEPYKAQSAVQFGARPVVDLFGPNGPTADLPLDGYFTTAKFAQANPKTIAAFARAMQKGAADASNRKTVEQLLPSYTKIDAKTAALVTLPTFPTSPDAKRLQRVADLMKDFGLLSTTMDVAPLVVVTPAQS